VFFQSECRKVTFRIYTLSDEQKASLIAFLLSPPPTADHPLPILGNIDNRIRSDPEEATERYSIFRDRWERASIDPHSMNWTRRVRTELDYPEIRDQTEMLNKLYELENAGPH
jgi:hypothetical protein